MNEVKSNRNQFLDQAIQGGGPLSNIDVSAKPSNPKDAIGVRKVPFSTIPAPVIAEIGLGMLEGACKYGRHNYRVIGVRTSVYYDAAMRHLTAFWEGEDIDPDSGLSHITKALSCLAVLRDAQMSNECVDDRPPIRIRKDWMEKLNVKAGEILDKYPEPLEAYTEKGLRDVKVGVLRAVKSDSV